MESHKLDSSHTAQIQVTGFCVDMAMKLWCSFSKLTNYALHSICIVCTKLCLPDLHCTANIGLQQRNIMNALHEVQKI